MGFCLYKLQLLKDGSNEQRAENSQLGRLAITDWDGVGDDAGKPVDVSPEGIDALLDIWPLFEAFQTEYVAGGLLLDAEKNVSSPLPNGSSAGATDIARAASPAGPTKTPAKPPRKS